MKLDLKEMIDNNNKHIIERQKRVLCFLHVVVMPTTTTCTPACRPGQEVQLFFRPNDRIGKKCDLSDFDHGMIVGARQGGLISWYFHAQHSAEFAENGVKNKKHPVSSSSAGKNM